MTLFSFFVVGYDLAEDCCMLCMVCMSTAVHTWPAFRFAVLSMLAVIHLVLSHHSHLLLDLLRRICTGVLSIMCTCVSVFAPASYTTILDETRAQHILNIGQSDQHAVRIFLGFRVRWKALCTLEPGDRRLRGLEKRGRSWRL